MKLHVEESGSGVPLLWIHGFPLSSAIYSRQMSIEGIHHIVPDLPGFGRSAPPDGETTMESYASAMLRQLDARRVEKAWIAGVSMGGYIAMALARIAPERVRGLILIDTRETPDTPEGKKGRYDSIAKVKQSGSIAPVVESMLPKMLSSSAPQPLIDEVRSIMESSSDKGVIAALRAMAERPDSSSLLPRLKVPALVAVGSADVITPVADAERMAKAIPNAKLVVLHGAGHMSQMEKADEFNEAVRAFAR